MPGKSRWFFDDTAGVGLGETISIVETLRINAELIQWSWHAGLQPVAGDLIEIKKGNLVIVTLDPADLGLTDIVCDNVWQFRRGDVVSMTYTNTDDQNVEAELIFREAAP